MAKNDTQAQADLADIVIEDFALQTALRDSHEYAEAAVKYRTANKAIKAQIAEKYPHAVNSDDDGEHSGYVRCGEFRFRPRYNEHDAEEVKFVRGEGKDWQPLDIERVV